MLQDMTINWRLVTSEVLQGFIPELVSFNIFITDRGRRQSALSSSLQVMPNWRDLTMHLRAGLPPRGTYWQEAWANGDLLKCSQDKCGVLPLGRMSPVDNTWGTAWQERP